MNNNYLYTVLPNNNKVIYTPILTFKNKNNNKSYIIYTDNSYDQTNKLRLFAAIYNPVNNIYLGEPNTKDEWDYIIKVLDKVLI